MLTVLVFTSVKSLYSEFWDRKKNVKRILFPYKAGKHENIVISPEEGSSFLPKCYVFFYQNLHKHCRQTTKNCYFHHNVLHVSVLLTVFRHLTLKSLN